MLSMIYKQCSVVVSGAHWGRIRSETCFPDRRSHAAKDVSSSQQLREAWCKPHMVIYPDESSVRAKRTNPGSRDVQRIRDRYMRALVRGDEGEAAAAVQEAVSFHWRPAVIYMDVLGKTMIEIGEMWHRGEISIAHEHQATQVTLRQAALLRQFFSTERKSGLHAVISVVERDGHSLGAMIFSDLLFFEGWNTDFLGAGTPASELGKLVTERKPDLVALSATMSGSLELLRESVRAAREAHPGTFIVVGGAAVSGDSQDADSLGADLVELDPVGAVADIGIRFDVAAAQVPLEQVLRRVGENVRSKRVDRGWSQQQLADAAGLDRTYLSGVEHGKQNLTLGAVKKLGDALNSPISDLLE